MPSVQKKRELLPLLNNIILAFSDLAPDVAILELEDSDASSRRVRARIIDILNNEVPALKNEITGVRINVNSKKKLPSDK
jgi:hypothetical protein